MRDILLQLDSYPEATSQEAIAQAARFAAAIGGVLSALAVEVEIRSPNNRVADYLIGLSRLARDEEQKSRRACESMLKAFRAEARELGVLGEARLGKADFYAIGDYVAERARTRDLCIVPVADILDRQRSIAEAVVFGSGRPVLLFRPGRADLPSAGFGTAVLAWDGSRSAARAMADALPVMLRAGEVQVLTVINEKPDARAGLGEEAVRHLKAHGVNAVAVEVDASGRRIGPVLDDYVAQRGSDLLIMGAYGRSKMREFILGGATEHMLHDPQTPLLLSH
ncbi:Universal stress protein family protein [compost metagenome]|jgi:nucleotide-binding universal stress UspA family protein